MQCKSSYTGSWSGHTYIMGRIHDENDKTYMPTPLLHLLLPLFLPLLLVFPPVRHAVNTASQLANALANRWPCMHARAPRCFPSCCGGIRRACVASPRSAMAAWGFNHDVLCNKNFIVCRELDETQCACNTLLKLMSVSSNLMGEGWPKANPSAC